MNRCRKRGRIAEQIEAVFAIDYRVAQVAELQGELRNADATFRVVKNTLTERAADEANAERLFKALLEGPSAR